MSLDLGNIWSKNKNSISNKPPVKKTFINRTIGKGGTIIKRGKNVWGGATWLLFHTIAENINTEWYSKNHKIVWDFIYDCCNNLPCPYCKNHAIDYLRKVKKDISTKSKLKKYLFDFHNSVNARVKKTHI